MVGHMYLEAKKCTGDFAHSIQKVQSVGLAPQNPFPCAVIDALSVYFYLLDEGFSANQIVFSGDSAGGGLALSTLLVLRDGGFSSPAGAICFSPWVDLTNSLPSFRLSGKTDYLPSQARDLKLGDRLHYYAENKELRNPYVSPLFAKSLRGLPPILIQVGSVERLRDECVLFATRASTSFLKNNSDYDIFDHTKVQFEIYEDQVHVFQIFHFLPCSVTAMNRAFDFFKSITDESSVEKLINFNSSNNLFDPAGKLVKMVTFDPTTGLYQKNGVLRSSKL
ncbi:hypothetical protein HDU92_005528 [Lobulomyces angularis]|nr:hypothetical protein HDU92_005528 [Lobulomyces angularis]